MIMLWSGSVASIPSGWLLCNGTNNTPNLQDKFVRGAGGATTSPGTTGGAEFVTLQESQMPAHSHNNGDFNMLLTTAGCLHVIASYSDELKNGVGCHQPGLVNSKSMLPKGGNQPINILPPFYVLAYIMKT